MGGPKPGSTQPNVAFFQMQNGVASNTPSAFAAGAPPGSNDPQGGVEGAFGNMSLGPPPPGGHQQGAQMRNSAAGGASSGAPGSMQSNFVEAPIIDPQTQCDPKYIRMTLGKIPQSAEAAKKIKIPLGVVLTPMAKDVAEENPVPTVNFGAQGLIRCKRSRTYINPFVSWLSQGRQWRCNVCGYVNEVPGSYFSHLDEKGQRKDRAQRPELNQGSIEIIAPSEYMLRPPQAPVYVFVLDVSMGAVQSGQLAKAVETIKECLDHLPGKPRTQIGFLALDSSIYFFNLKSTLSTPQMLCVPDLEELFMPLPDDLLANLSESRHVVDALLEALPNMFANTRKMECALGPALTAAYRVMGHIGGKMVVFLSNLPSIGDARLKHRDNPRTLGTDKEQVQLVSQDDWYKDRAIEFSKLQICLDLFLFSSQYTDVATLSMLPKYTGGSMFYYPGFTSHRDGPKFKSELTRVLRRQTGFEAVMRVRVSRGLKISNFYGNFYIRGTDLLALPNSHPDNSFAFEITHEDAVLSSNIVSIQAALLYTTSGGERRIRVHTAAIPVAQIIQDIISTVDVDTLCNIMARQAMDTALMPNSSLDNARHKMQSQCIDILRASVSGQMSGAYTPGQPMASTQQQQGPTYPEALQLLPLYTMALQKSVVFRGGSTTRPDERMYNMLKLNVMSVSASRYYIYPRMFALHCLPKAVGRPPTKDTPKEMILGEEGKEGAVVLPPMQSLTVDRLSSDGVFMLENSVECLIWVGGRADPNLINALFGVTSLEQQDLDQVALLKAGSEIADQVASLMNALELDRDVVFQVHIVREADTTTEHKVFSHLVEDRAAFQGGSYSYHEFISLINRHTRGVAS